MSPRLIKGAEWCALVPEAHVQPSEETKTQKPSILISHPTGNQNVRNAVQSLAERDMLAEFWTTLAWHPGSRLSKLLPQYLKARLARRAYQEAPRDRVRSVLSREIVRLAAGNSPIKRVLSSAERPFSVIGMYRHFDGKVASRVRHVDIDAVYAYEGGALQTFREAKRRQMSTIYDLPSGHWHSERVLMEEEAIRSPEFRSIIPKLSDSDRHLREKDEEIRLADMIIVASQHVRRTLVGFVPDERIRVVPYGAPPVRYRADREASKDRPLRVLFAGSLHQRKGIGYLLKAINMLESMVALTLVGKRFAENAIVDDACQRWNWHETLPHNDMLEIMLGSDVLVLPSISEGFGLVVTEALSCGLPVIITPNVGASDLVRDGSDGFVVPVGSAEAIADRLHKLYCDRNLLAQMSMNAQTTAAKNSWELYRESLANYLKAKLCS